MKVSVYESSNKVSSVFFRVINALLYVWHPRLVWTYVRMRRRLPDIAFPKRIEEKFLWRKVFDHNPTFTEVSDKLKAKDYVARVCPELPTAEVLWVGSDPEQIPDKVLAGDVVVKANHGSTFNLMVMNGSAERCALEQQASVWLAHKWGRTQGEWAYFDIEPRIFVERMLCHNGLPANREYKVHVTGGRAVHTFCVIDRYSPNRRAALYDHDGNVIETTSSAGYKMVETPPPKGYSAAVRFAERLGAGFDYVRCDLYDIDGVIYFGELTLYPLSGYGWFSNQALMKEWNESWDLRQSWFLTSPRRGVLGKYARRLRAALEAAAGPDQF